MAGVVAKRWVGVLLALYAFGTDWLSGWHGMNFAMRGLLDWPAHVATALVILGSVTRVRRALPDQRFGWAMLACSVLIDVDHLPAEFGSYVLTNGTPRPYTHALWTVIVLTLAWAAARFFVIRSGRPRPATVELVLAGAAWGVAAHFVRDIATAPMSFWWPVTEAAVEVPYWWYVVALAVIIAVGPVSKGRTMDTHAPSDPGTSQVAMELGDDCVACGSDRTRGQHNVPEVMFRTGDSFTYRECDICGSLQINTVPLDLAAHYDPDRYYSFAELNQKLQRQWLRWLPTRLALRLNTEIYLRTGLGRGLSWARKAGIRPADRILDFGCGRGENLLLLHLLGYRHLLGADAFLDTSTEIAPGVPILKATHEELKGRFNWVMMHHLFEHIADPRALLASVQRILADDGQVLIRMPVAGGLAWRKYGVNWVQIDAPRHLALYTIEGFRQVAEECGFLLDDVFFDSSSFQFYGSELARSETAIAGGHIERFSAQQMTAWATEAERLNRTSDGDQACFILRSAQRQP